MLISQGIDIVRVKRIEKIFSKYKENFLKKIFSINEIKSFNLKTPLNITSSLFLSNRFAAKEAASKALGTGFSSGVRFVDIEIVKNNQGKPFLKFKGTANKVFKRLEKNGQKIISELSMSNEKDYAIAIVSFSLVRKKLISNNL